MDTILSIIIPTYNRPDMLKRAVGSVRNQTEGRWEVIVVNDGEDMGISQYLESLQDERIVYTQNLRTKGGNGARNTGIQLAKADYIAFLDDDDEFHEDKVKIHLQSFIQEGQGSGCSVSGYYCVPKNFRREDSTQKLKPSRFQHEFTSANIMMYKAIFGASSTILVKKSFIEEAGMFDESLQRCQDLELMIRLASKSSVHVCHKPLVYVYGHNESSLEQYEKVKLVYWNLIGPYLKKLSSEIERDVFANEYRVLAILASREKNYKKMYYYLKESTRRKVMSPRQYFGIVLNLLCNTFGLSRK